MLGQFFEFTAVGSEYDLFKFEVEDTYFNDPTSYTVQVVDATHAKIKFNEYGRFKVTATGVYNPALKGAYEVGKYYRPDLPYRIYDRTGAGSFGYNHTPEKIGQWFTCYETYNKSANRYENPIENYEHRIVVKARQRSFLNTFPGRIDHRWGPELGEITGTGAVGANKITLPDTYRQLFPDSLNTPTKYTVLEPLCENTFEFPADRFGVL